MISWIAENIGTILVLAVVLGLALLAIGAIRRARTSGKSPCGGCCSSCGGACGMHHTRES